MVIGHECTSACTENEHEDIFLSSDGSPEAFVEKADYSPFCIRLVSAKDYEGPISKETIVKRWERAARSLIPGISLPLPHELQMMKRYTVRFVSLLSQYTFDVQSENSSQEEKE